MFLALALSAYSQSKSGIADVKWKLTQANGKPVTNSTAFIEVDAREGRFTGNSGCNQMSGPVVTRGRAVHFGNAILTRRACKLMEGNIPESEFVAALGKSIRYTRSGSSLTFYDRRGRRILKFKAMPRDDGDDVSSDLGSRKWFLQSIGTRQTLVAIKGVFINFDETQHSAGGNTGCNVFGGKYSASGRTISITDVISTMRACEDDGRMQLERDLLEGLRNADRYRMANGVLTLYQSNTLLLTFRGEPK